MPPPDNAVEWDLTLVYRMVRQRDHALTDRQRRLQDEQASLKTQLDQLGTKIIKLADAIAVVEKAGGNADSLRSQIGLAHAERRRIEPRHAYLKEATSLIAANLRLTGMAHDALHWLNYENGKLVAFDHQPVVSIPARDLAETA